MTVSKLIEWLRQFPEDTLVYAFENNTGDWQEIPDFGEDGKNMFFKTANDCKKDELAWLKNYYKNEKEAQRKLADEFKYVESSDAILLRG